MKLFTFIIMVLTPIFSFAQKEPKIDFDDDIITIDKVKKYDFVVTKKGGFTALSAATIKNLNGEDVFIIKDTMLTFDNLDHELEKPREYKRAHIFHAPILNKKVFIEPIELVTFRKLIFKDLKKTTFFSSDGQDTTWFNIMCDSYGFETMKKSLAEYEDMKAKRAINAQKTTEKHGPLQKRKTNTVYGSTFMEPYDITEGGKRLATLERGSGGSFSIEYKVINKDKIVIANFYVQPSKAEGNVVTNVDNLRKYFTFLRTDTLEIQIKKIGEYLVNYGYL